MTKEVFQPEKSVIITGAASGFGRETADIFSQNKKYIVYAADKDEKIHQVFPPSKYKNVRTIDLDVRDPDQIINVVEKIGPVHILINNAGILNSGRVATYLDSGRNPTPELRDLWETNLRGPLLLMNKVANSMRENSGGTIINVTSTSYHNRSPYRGPYADYKAVLVGATKEFARRVAKDNIRVINVQPGMHKTAIERNIWTSDSNQKEAEAAQWLYDWWRKAFGADPKNVAKVIYTATEGNTRNGIILVGWDAHLTSFMDENIPYWDKMFTLGYNTLLSAVQIGLSFHNKK